MATTATKRWQQVIGISTAVAAASLCKLIHAHACAAREETKRAVELKDTLLATVSHELRTPLNAIIGWVHVMKSGHLAPDESARALGAIERNALLQARLVNELLDVSRLIQGRVSLAIGRVELRSVLGAAVEEMTPIADAKGVAIALPPGRDEMFVRGDEARLRDILRHLLSNAVKFTPAGGRVSIELASGADGAVLFIRDTGEGIQREYLPHVFDVFGQGKTRSMRTGLGLGLAIVQRLVALHGGQVQADSDGEGCGSTFSVRLPLMQPA